MKLIALNHSNKQVAEKLGLTFQTIEGQRNRIHKRLGIHTCTELVHYALHHGLVKNLYD